MPTIEPCGRTRSGPILLLGTDIAVMKQTITKPAKEPAPVTETTKEAAQEPAKIGSVQVEALARNIARMVEEGGKALAAYMKPREEGKIKSETADDVTDVVKTIGHVAEYWLSDPQRALELQTSLGRAYLDLWANTVKRMAGEAASPVVAPDRPGVVAKPVLRFSQAGLSTHRAMGREAGQGRRWRRPPHAGEGCLLRQTNHQRYFAVEFRLHQSGIAARNFVVECR
jgi:hypothetical protein